MVREGRSELQGEGSRSLLWALGLHPTGYPLGAGVEHASSGVRKLGSFSTNPYPHWSRACSLEALTPPYFWLTLGRERQVFERQ